MLRHDYKSVGRQRLLFHAATQVLAGALRDGRGASVAGERTFGKGLIQVGRTGLLCDCIGWWHCNA